nr:precorrin-8X methylmutase [Nakamurella sp. PAMC28650]
MTTNHLGIATDAQPQQPQQPQPPPRRYDYVTDGAQIYLRSFATIRRETDMSGLPAAAEKLAVRMVHATGQIDLVADLRVHPDLVPAARAALESGAPIFTDANMVASGITRARLPAANDVICLLRDPRVPELARRWDTTRSAAAVSLWGERLAGAVVAIGNAPTALFHLLEMISAGGPRPAVIVGIPVGFIGAMESKEALLQHESGIPYVVVRGRRGGSALAAAAVNALAQERE